jgi:D-alanyl-lipoteichoic acid acyltransferase DltB (MBOAT superfamily)
MLGWFKYANFVVENISAVTGHVFEWQHVALPLAISFYTFQKIAYLVDSARGDANRMGLLEFFLFTSFFPQLISGPIVHYKEVVPQIRAPLFGRLNWRNIIVGLVIMSIGLFKKTVLADTISSYVDPLYTAAEQHKSFGLMSGWLAAATYTFQIYFDFSGYSDMALGLARMFGIKLPLNFHSPLRASSIADYWRRWHMTLRKFVYAYIFQPLSLSLNRWAARHRLSRRSAFTVGVEIPTVVTFVIVGIWHGAGWTFFVFGLMHAVYLTLQLEAARHKMSRKRVRKLGREQKQDGLRRKISAHVLTLVAIAFANVVFRANSVQSAWRIWMGMVGISGDEVRMNLSWGLVFMLMACVAVTALFPNTQQIMRRFEPASDWAEWRNSFPSIIQWTWRPSTLGLAFAGLTLFLGVMFVQRGQAVFLYFNF